jgi:hypothetical protein
VLPHFWREGERRGTLAFAQTSLTTVRVSRKANSWGARYQLNLLRILKKFRLPVISRPIRAYIFNQFRIMKNSLPAGGKWQLNLSVPDSPPFTSQGHLNAFFPPTKPETHL